MKTIAIIMAATGALLTTQAQAQSTVGEAELRNVLTGRTVALSDGAQATYHANGAYAYQGSRGASTGHYTISNGQVCVEFFNQGAGQARCDTISKKGNQYFLTNSSGRTFPLRLN